MEIKTRYSFKPRCVASLTLALVLGAAACTDSGSSEDTDPTGEEVLDESVVLLSPTDRLVRIAMAIKGTRPSLDELDAVVADPSAIEWIVDDYLESPEFGATVRDVENQTLLMRMEDTPNGELPAEAGPLGSVDIARFYFEEPLRLIEDIVIHDQSYAEILTSATTMSSRYGPYFWAGLEDGFDPEGPEWQRLGYTDQRPAAGILTTGAFIKRYASSNKNAHRQAAAAVAEALLCTSYNDRDIPIGSVDVTDEDAIEEAILTNSSCVSCHQTMDPLAGFFDGFPRRTGFGLFPSLAWSSSEVGSNSNKTGRDNGYYGLGGETLDDLGPLIAADHRFSSCTARRYIAYLAQIPRGAVPLVRVSAAQRALVDNGMNIKEMVRTIVLADSFAVAYADDPEVAEELVGYLQTRPEQLERMFEELTGFTWRTRLSTGNDPDTVIDLLNNSNYGFRVHGGGLDNEIKVLPVHHYSAHASALLRNLAGEAAGAVTAADFALPAEQRALLRLVEPDTSEEAAVREQLVFLHWRILAEDLASDSAPIDHSYALFTEVLALSQDLPTTWKTVLTALFQDFRVAYH